MLPTIRDQRSHGTVDWSTHRTETRRLQHLGTVDCVDELKIVDALPVPRAHPAFRAGGDSLRQR